MPQRTVSLFGVNFDELNARGEPECLAAGREPGAGDSGYQGTNPMAERASLSGPGAAWIKCPHILRGGHSLCMRSTFKIMSFLSKGLPEGPLPGFGGEGEEGVGTQHFQGLEKKAKREAVVLRESFINGTEFLLPSPMPVQPNGTSTSAQPQLAASLRAQHLTNSPLRRCCHEKMRLSNYSRITIIYVCQRILPLAFVR